MLAKSHAWILLLLALCLAAPFGAWASGTATPTLPVKGMVTLVELGSEACYPCRRMAPVLEELKKKYQGKAAIVVLDVWEDRALAYQFGVRVIPTLIFYDRQGREVGRHEGFLPKKYIEQIFQKLGVDKPANN